MIGFEGFFNFNNFESIYNNSVISLKLNGLEEVRIQSESIPSSIPVIYLLKLILEVQKRSLCFPL